MCWNSKGLGTREQGLSRSTEEQGVVVRVANLKAAQTVVGILKRFAEIYGSIGKLGGKRVGILHIDEGIQPQVVMPLVVWLRRDAAFRFNEDLRSVAADDGEEGVLIRRLISCLETKLVAIEGDGLGDVADDEGWRNVPDFGTSHSLCPFQDGPMSAGLAYRHIKSFNAYSIHRED